VAYGTVTGRFSCREPNLQNIPRPDTDLGKKIRGLFKAPPGYKMVVADYGQIEMILLAHFIGRGALYEGIHNGMDPHSATGAGLIGMDPAEFMRLKDAGDKEIADSARSPRVSTSPSSTEPVREGRGSMASVSVNKAKQLPGDATSRPSRRSTGSRTRCSGGRGRRPPHIRTIMGRKRRLPALLSRD
jgi:hypothetical protein